MLPNLTHLSDPTPSWLDILFLAVTLLTFSILYITIRRVSPANANRLLLTSLIWLTILALLAHNHFFYQFNTRPPRFLLVLGLPLFVIIGVLITTKGRFWTRALSLPSVTLLHTVRAPVEFVLYSLYGYEQIPQLMTFDGRNFDILAGLTAPVVAYLAFRGRLSTRGLLIWNILALALVLNIVALAVLSAPFPFQQFAFAQPNVAVFKFPYVWLPGFIVPAVLFAHAVVIQQLVKR